jgi:hypothetical protein
MKLLLFCEVKETQDGCRSPTLQHAARTPVRGGSGLAWSLSAYNGCGVLALLKRCRAVTSRNTFRVIAENFVGSTRVEQWQRGTVTADFHDVLDQILDRLVPFEAFAKGVDYGLSPRLAPRLACDTVTHHRCQFRAYSTQWSRRVGDSAIRAFGSLLLPKS